MYIVKTEAYDQNGVSFESQYDTDQDLEEIFHDLVTPTTFNIAYSRIEIINYDK